MAIPDIHKLNTVPARTTVYAMEDMLKAAENKTVLRKFGQSKPVPRNKGANVTFRRVNPWNMASNGAPGTIDPATLQLAEGVNPPTYSITYTDVSATLKHYGIAFKYSQDVELLYEDKVASDITRQVGQVMADMLEYLTYNVLKGGTVVDYADSASARTDVNDPISIEQLRRIARTLYNARASMVTTKIDAGMKYATAPIEAGWIVFAHTDMAADIRDLPGFKHQIEYAADKKVAYGEIGAVEEFRFILNPMFAAFAGGGSATINGMKSSAGSPNVDVYPFLVIGEDAFGHVALKGFDAVKPVIHPATPSKADTFGQWGVVGAQTWAAPVRLNENFMVRGEAGVTAL
jgi:N4-gp56 family major capsid protein